MSSLPKGTCDAHALLCDLAAEALRSSGKLRLRVNGRSMLPAVWPGDTLLVECAKEGAVHEGDIVLFGRDRRLFAHRVLAKTPAHGGSTIATRGDAMPQPDPPISSHELLGKVAFISRNGKLIKPKKQRVPQRAMSALLRRSKLAARVAVGIHNFRRTSQRTTSQAPEPSFAPVSR
jgi:signal peptidase I